MIWLKESWAVLALIGALFTGAYYWDDIRAAQNANDIARLSVTPKIKILAAEVSYSVALNKPYLQQMSSRRIVVRLANIGSVQTSLTAVEFDGFAKALDIYNLPKQWITFSYGKPFWEPFEGYAAFVWSEEVPDFSNVVYANLKQDPWRIEDEDRVPSKFDFVGIEETLKSAGLPTREEKTDKEETDGELERRAIVFNTIPGSNLPVVIPANSTVDIVVDILVRNRASVDDIFNKMMREIKVNDRGFKGDLVFRFPDTNPVAIKINESSTQSSLATKENLLRPCGCPYYIATYKLKENNSNYYKIAKIE